MITARSGNRTTAPANPLMDYEGGKADPRKMLWAVAYAAVGLLVCFPVGGTLAILCRPPAYGEWSGWAALGAFVGVGIIILGVVLIVVPIVDYFFDTMRYRVRLAKAFDQELKLRELTGGLVVHEEFEEFCFYAERPNDMLLIITALTRRAATDPSWRPSIATLIDEGVWVGNRKLGNVNTSQARKILSDLAEMGFIRGRTDGAAGVWAYTSVDEALDRFERKGA